MAGRRPRNRSSVQVGGAAATTYTFDDANRVTADSAGGTYTADADGRLTSRPGQRLAWDSLGRLTRVLPPTGAGTLATYTYDPLDRLRLADDGTTRTRFRYVGQTTAIAQTVNDQNGTVITSIGNDWTGEHRLDWTGSGQNVRFYGTNAHHDLTWTADAAGAVSATLRYDPWGTLTSSTGTSLPAFRFQGSWADPATNLAWVITRWYAPALGTSISEDSLTGDPADPPSRHLYAYAGGNPVLGWDPDGRFFRRVRFGETLESISKKLYGFSDAASLIRGNPGGRFTPIRLTFANPRVGAGQCIWIPFVNGLTECHRFGDAPYGGALYTRYNGVLRDVHKRMVLDRQDQWVGFWSYTGDWSTGITNSLVLARFASKVRAGGSWDQKPLLRRDWGEGRGFHMAIQGDPAPESLYYDVWGNVHYGYVGRAHGIPADLLRLGGIIAGGVDTPSDRRSVDIGIELWDRFHGQLGAWSVGAAIRNSMWIYRADPDLNEVQARLRG